MDVIHLLFESLSLIDAGSLFLRLFGFLILSGINILWNPHLHKIYPDHCQRRFDDEYQQSNQGVGWNLSGRHQSDDDGLWVAWRKKLPPNQLQIKTWSDLLLGRAWENGHGVCRGVRWRAPWVRAVSGPQSLWSWRGIWKCSHHNCTHHPDQYMAAVTIGAPESGPDVV